MAKSRKVRSAAAGCADRVRSEEPKDIGFGIDDVCVQDLETEEFRTIIEQVLPIADAERRVEAFAEVILSVRWYRAFRQTRDLRLSAEEIRRHLRRGLAGTKDLENWVKTAPRVVRDHVLSAIGEQPLIGESPLADRSWTNLGEFFNHLATKIEAALQLVQSDRGRLGNLELNDLVWSLALIWEKYVDRPPFGLTKRRPAPLEFVRLVCRAAAPGAEQADLDREIKTAVRSARIRLGRRRDKK
jgi:hypothetical protein